MPEGFFFAVVAVFSSPVLFAKRLQTPQAAAGGAERAGEGPAPCTAACAETPKWETEAREPPHRSSGVTALRALSPLPQEHWGGCGTPLKALFSPKTLRRRSSRGGGRLFSIWRTRTSTSHTRGVVFPLSQRGCTYPSNHRSPTLPSLTALCHHRTRSGAKPRARCAQPAAGLSEMEMHPPNRGHGDGEAAGSAFPPPLH